MTRYAEVAAPALAVVATMGGGGESGLGWGWAGLGWGWAGAGLVCSAAVTHQISTTHTVQAGYSALSRPRLRKILPKHYLQLYEHQPSSSAASSRYATGHFQPCSLGLGLEN